MTSVGTRERITIPAPNVEHTVLDSDGMFRPADSEIRPIVPLHAVPWLVLTHDELRALPLDSRTGFVLSLVDGRCTVEMILDMAGLPEDETMRLLAQLLTFEAIELRDG